MADSATPATSQHGAGRRSKEERRRELVEAAMRAIRRGDPSLSMNDLAAEAGITKPILYRHFGDRQGLVNAITLEMLSQLVGLPGERLKALSRSEDQSILELKVAAPDATPDGLRSLIDSLVATFLDGVEREPELFAFVMQEDGFRSVGALLNPAATPGSHLGNTLARLMRAVVEARGGDATVTEPLGQIIAGAVENSVQWWSTSGPRDRDRMAGLLGDFIWAGTKSVLDLD